MLNRRGGAVPGAHECPSAAAVTLNFAPRWRGNVAPDDVYCAFREQVPRREQKGSP